MSHNLLLLSSSTVYGREYLEHAHLAIGEFLEPHRSVLFAPFAWRDHNAYTDRVQRALSLFGVDVVSLHTVADPRAAVADATLLFVGGGNTFRLAKAMQELDVIALVRDRVRQGGLSYLGSSAGTNLVCPTLRTTNDMPIVEPRSFDALNLVPFQINPHYMDIEANTTHMGETREMRIGEFLNENDVAVVGLREGSWLRRRGDHLLLDGNSGARLFERGKASRELVGGDDLSNLLTLTPRFDRPVVLE